MDGLARVHFFTFFLLNVELGKVEVILSCIYEYDGNKSSLRVVKLLPFQRIVPKMGRKKKGGGGKEEKRISPKWGGGYNNNNNVAPDVIYMNMLSVPPRIISTRQDYPTLG